MATVLIIDDDNDSRDALSKFLARAGHTVRCASSGRQAVDELSAAVPNAVVLDVRMPDMDGIAVLGLMRSYLKWSEIPVAIFTAYPDDPRLWHVDQCGVGRVFAKGRDHVGDVLEWVERQRPYGGPSAGSSPGGSRPTFSA